MPSYASTTSVSVEKTQSEIRTLLARSGATKFGLLEEDGQAAILFDLKDRRIKFVIVLPKRTESRFIRGRYGKLRPIEAQHKEWEQACRARWRALFLSIKAKLVTVESAISSFEEEFYAHVMLPTGQTIYEASHQAVQQAYLSGEMPRLLLPGIGETSATVH